MQARASTRYAWKAFRGLRALQLTPTVLELPPSILYAIRRDGTLKPIFEHEIKVRLINDGVTAKMNHVDDIRVNLFPSKPNTTISNEERKAENELFKVLLESKETRDWDPDLLKLLAQIQSAPNPMEAFQQMSQRMDPYLKQLLIGLMNNLQRKSMENPGDDTEKIINELLEKEKNRFIQLSKTIKKTENVFDDLLVKRLDPTFIEKQREEAYENHLKKIESTNPFDRVDAEFNTFHPVQAYIEATKLLYKFGQSEEGKDESDEAEAIRRITKIGNDLLTNFDSLFKENSTNSKLNKVSARYKAMNELLRDSKKTKFLDPREEEHMRRYYTMEVHKLEPSAFLSFEEVLSTHRIDAILGYYNKVQDSPDNKELLESVSAKYNTSKDAKAILSHLKQLIKDDLKNQWGKYYAKVKPLRELNKKFVQEQQSYLSEENFKLAQLQYEQEELEIKLMVVELYDNKVEPIVDRLTQIDLEIVNILLRRAEQASPSDNIKTAISIVRRLAEFEYKQQQHALYKQMRRFAYNHPYTNFLNEDLDYNAFIKHEEKMANDLEKEIDAALSPNQFKELTSALKTTISEINTDMNLPRETLVKNNNQKRALVDLYNLLQKYGIKAPISQFKYIQKAREDYAAEEEKLNNPEQLQFNKQMEELMECARKETISHNSIHKGLLSFNMTEAVMKVLNDSPAIRERARQLIAPKKYYSREVELEKSGRVAPKYTVMKKRTTSVMPEGYRRKSDRKVVLTVKVKDLGLTDIQKQRLIAIAGPKYIKGSDSIKIVVRLFETSEESEIYARNYLYALIEAAKDENIALEPAAEEKKITPLELMQEIYTSFGSEDEQSADALEKWIIYKESGTKVVGADLTYGEGVRQITYGEAETKAIKDKYGYTIHYEEEEEEFVLPEGEEDEE